MRPEPMVFAEIICRKHKTQRLLSQMADEGILHLVESPTYGRYTEPLLISEEMEHQASQLKHRLDSVVKILRMMDISVPVAPRRDGATVVEPDAMTHVELVLARVEEPLLDLAERFRGLKQQRDQLTELYCWLQEWAFLTVPLEAVRQLRSAKVYLGTVPKGRAEEQLLSLTNMVWSLPSKDTKRVLVAFILPASQTQAFEALAQQMDWRSVDLPDRINGQPEKELLDVQRRLDEVDGKLAEMRRQVLGLAHQVGTQLAEADFVVSAKLYLLECLHYLQATSQVAIITGFVRRRDVGRLEKLVDRKELGPVVLRLYPAEEKAKELGLEIPVQLSNPRLLRPFQQLVQTYGLPRYDESDPTLVLGMTYSVMFGFMFGDVGQGLVLLLIGALLTFGWTLLPALTKSDLRPLGNLITLCGLAATVLGLLFGTVFGSEKMIPPLWVHPMEHINQILAAGTAFGVLLVSLGLALHLYNNWKRGDRFETFFGEFGLFSSLTYWFALAGLTLILLGSPINGLVPLWILTAMAAVVFTLGHHYGWLSEGEQGSNRSVVSTVLSVFDVGLRYVTNTVSFIRLSAFALAHGALGITIYAVADSLREFPLGTLWWTVTVIVGNILVIGLEGLVVGIQALRLEFYEFFSKFLSGEGKPFSPLFWPRT